MTYVAGDRNIPKVIGKEKSQNMRLAVQLANPFGNRGDWQFGWPTDSLIFHIRQYIQLPVHKTYLN